MKQRPSFALNYPGIEPLLTDIKGKFARQGLKVRSAREVTIGEDVEILVRVPENPNPLLLQGVIAWISPQPDPEGKRVLLIRDLRLSNEAQRQLEILKRRETHTPTLEEIPEAEVELPSPPPASRSLAEPSEAKTSEETLLRRFLWLWITLGVLLLLGGAATWLSLGGLRWIQMNLLSPPSFVHLPPPPLTLRAPEPSLPRPEAPPPPPKKIPPLIILDFEFAQRPQENEFVIIFNRPFSGVEVLPGESPGQVVFFIPRSRVQLEKEQYFFPYEYVQSALFEEEEGGAGVRIVFFGKNPNYIPKPQWEERGRELVIRFVPTS